MKRPVGVVDPSLPAVRLDSLRCPGCGQPFDVIFGGGAAPEVHYSAPTHGNDHGRPVERVATRRGNQTHAQMARLCDVDGDVLVALIYWAQRDAAGLDAPRLARHGDDRPEAA